MLREPGTPVKLRPEDFEVYRTEHMTRTATMVAPSNPAVMDSSEPAGSDPFVRLTAPFESAPTTGI